MKTHGKLKASITVETAFVLPIVLGALYAVLVIVFNMFQSASQLAVLNMNALYGVNYIAHADSQNNIDIMQILKLDADYSVTTDFGASVIIRGKMKTLDASFIGIPKRVWQTSGIASYINPSQYIRETDGNRAMLKMGIRE